MKNRANVDFLTNAAVAWFAAGVIAPIFNKPQDLVGLVPYILSALATVLFILIANFLERRNDE